MPDDKNLSLRDAGNRIAEAGLTDDVIHASERQISQRRGRQREAAEDTDADRGSRARQEEKRKKPPRLPEDDEDDQHEAEDLGRYDGEDDGDEDDADDRSNQDGDQDDSEDDGSEDREDSERDDDAATSDDDREYTVKVNGKEYSVPVKELIAGYQRGRDYHQKTQALATNGRNLTAGHQKVAESYARKLQQANAIVAGVRNLLIGDINSAEMQALRARDPGQWAVQRQVMQDRIGQVDTVLRNIHSEHERHTREFEQTQNAARNATVEQERALIVEAIPDWNTGGSERLAHYLVSSGFTVEEIDGTVDARMLKVAEKARKWDALQRAKKQQTRKAKPAPRVPARPGQSQIRKGTTQQMSKRRDFETAKRNAAKTGDMRDAGKAISRLL